MSHILTQSSFATSARAVVSLQARVHQLSTRGELLTHAVPVKTTTKGKRKADLDVKTDHGDHTSDSDIEILNTPPPKKKTKHSSRPSVDEDEPDDSVDMAFCVEVQTPPPPILAVRKTSAKAPPPKTTELGPYKFNLAKDYPDFLHVIAKACQTTTSNLDVVSMMWKFDRPNNSKPKPVTNKTGFDVMITTLLGRRKDYNFVILMAPPNAVKKELPWVKDEDDGNGGGPPLDFEYSLDDFTAGPSSVLSIRQQILNELLERYPIDNSPLFPVKRIYHNETGYFDLNDVRLRVWAVHVFSDAYIQAKGTATVDKAPASNHFFKNQMIRPPSAFATVAAPPPAFAPIAAVPNVAAPEPLMQLLLNMQMMNQINPLFNPALVPPYGHMQPQQAPPLPQYTPHPVQSTPLFLPREISLDEYFDRYKIDSEDQHVLKELGYVPGDEGIEELPKEVWEMPPPARQCCPLLVPCMYEPISCHLCGNTGTGLVNGGYGVCRGEHLGAVAAHIGFYWNQNGRTIGSEELKQSIIMMDAAVIQYEHAVFFRPFVHKRELKHHQAA
ncbi:hypothetical protein C8R44DRAFT_747582 [Mycena epipterygia]|nr:hypothetical protein C8R44DRAFT_747582 [Mycena epipterygia]